MRDIILIRKVVQEISNFVYSGKLEKPNINTHSNNFTKIPQSTVHEDNSDCLKFATMPKMSSRTKNIAVPYHFFRSRVASLEMQVVAIGKHNQKGDKFTKGLLEPKFVRDRNNLMGW